MRAGQFAQTAQLPRRNPHQANTEGIHSKAADDGEIYRLTIYNCLRIHRLPRPGRHRRKENHQERAEGCFRPVGRINGRTREKHEISNKVRTMKIGNSSLDRASQSRRWTTGAAAMKNKRLLLWAAVLVFGTTLCAPATQAKIVRIQINTIESPTFEGRSFGEVGQYEKLVGRAFGELDPNDPHNAMIVDIGLAPRNASGMVEYSMDIYILRPVDSANGNGRLFFEINNRGNKLSFGGINDSTSGGNDPTTAADAGNGFLMRQGYTIVWSGWDVTAPPGGGRFTINVPVAKNAD